AHAGAGELDEVEPLGGHAHLDVLARGLGRRHADRAGAGFVGGVHDDLRRSRTRTARHLAVAAGDSLAELDQVRAEPVRELALRHGRAQHDVAGAARLDRHMTLGEGGLLLGEGGLGERPQDEGQDQLCTQGGTPAAHADLPSKRRAIWYIGAWTTGPTRSSSARRSGASRTRSKTWIPTSWRRLRRA